MGSNTAAGLINPLDIIQTILGGGGLRCDHLVFWYFMATVWS